MWDLASSESSNSKFVESDFMSTEPLMQLFFYSKIEVSDRNFLQYLCVSQEVLWGNIA